MVDDFLSIAPLLVFLAGINAILVYRSKRANRRRMLNQTANRLGFEIQRERLKRQHVVLPPELVRELTAAFGVVDGYKVQFDRRGKLHEFDDVPKNSVRISVEFDAMREKFRVTTPDYAGSGAVELLGEPGLVVETEAPAIVDKLLSPTRRRILSQMIETWPISEARHNRLIIIAIESGSDPMALEETIRRLVAMADGFVNDSFQRATRVSPIRSDSIQRDIA